MIPQGNLGYIVILVAAYTAKNYYGTRSQRSFGKWCSFSFRGWFSQAHVGFFLAPCHCNFKSHINPVYKTGWLPREGKFRMHDGWCWTSEVYHLQWRVKSTITKAKNPLRNTNLDPKGSPVHWTAIFLMNLRSWLNDKCPRIAIEEMLTRSNKKSF